MFHLFSLKKWLVPFEALALVTALMIYFQVIPEWGSWYSENPSHRLQTEAFLHGRLALGNSPTLLQSGFAWSEGGAQQVSGLGVPIWRLPFEALARLFGQPGFPDRLEMAAAILVVTLQVFYVWLSPCLLAFQYRGGRTGVPDLIGAVGVVVVLLAFTPFITLLRTPLDVYEEVLVYTYLYGISLTAGLVWFIRRPSWLRFWSLSLLAGLGGLMRPTLVFYGIVTMILMTVRMVISEPLPGLAPGEKSIVSRLGKGFFSRIMKLQLWAGWGLYIAGGLLLFFTNQMRFGNGFEFGHRLNIVRAFPPVVYATRFDHPFETEPLGAAAKELFGSLFFVKNLNGMDVYRALFFPGQSETFRWRAFYFTTFDWSFIVAVLAGWIWGAWVMTGFLRQRTAEATKAEGLITNECLWMALWSLGNTGLLAVFYLRVPCTSSRYMMDFAPAFAVSTVVLWSKLSGPVLTRIRFRLLASIGLLMVLLGWTGVELSNGHCVTGGPRSVTWDQISLSVKPSAANVNLPESAYVEGADFRQSNIPDNGIGWEGIGRTVAPAVAVFVKDPDFIELEVAPEDRQSFASVPLIRAKIGLEFLVEASRIPVGNGVLVRFFKPKQARYQHGIQALFLAFGPKERLANQLTPYRLLRVSWNTGKNP